jgi:von Willebrand factor type A domain
MLSSRVVALGVVLSASLAGTNAQETGCAIRTLPIAVRDALGNPIRGLAPSDFEAKIHGKSAPIVSFEPDLRLHRLVILLDTSGSMGGGDVPSHRWNLAVTLALHAAQSAGPRTQLALLLFGEQVKELDDFSKGNAAIIARLTQIATDKTFVKTNVKGRTALYDSLAKAFNLLDHPTSADALYVITDGGDNHSRLRPDGIQRLLEPSMVRLFVTLLLPDLGYRNLTPEEMSGPEDLSTLVKESGGTMLLSSTNQDSKNWYSLVSRDKNATTQQVLVRFYRSMLENDLITVQVPPELHKRERLDLKLSEVDRKKWKDAQILYPSEIEPCALASSSAKTN